MLLPIGLDETRVSRLPWVSIALVALSVAVWLGLALGGGSDTSAELDAVVSYWRERPYLDLPESFERRTRLSAEDLARLARVELPAERPASAAREQEELDALCQAWEEADAARVDRRFALVPERGLVQPGWIGYQFLHGGFGHLLGNMLVFFLVVGPFLEDVWGRPFFLAFYLAGGVLAGVAQVVPDPSSPIPIVGASGAIAACLGAFALRFAHRRVRMFYWFFLVVRGTFFVPAWAYAFFVFATDLLALHLNGAGGGVAYAAHVGGFVFGLAVAFVVRATDLEKRIAPEGAAEWGGSIEATRAAEALAGGRVSDARGHYATVLAKRPDDPEALLGMARIAAQGLERATATELVDRLLGVHLARNDAAGAGALLAELWPVVDAAAFRPQIAYRAADLAAPHDAAFAEALDERAATAGGAVAAKALLRAAGRCRERDAALALSRAERAAAIRDLPPELARRAAELVAALRAEPGSPAPPVRRFAAVEPPPHPVAFAPPHVELPPDDATASRLAPEVPIRLLRCRLLGSSDAGLDLAVEGGKRAVLPAERVAALAAGVVDAEEPGGGARRSRLLLDLLLRPRNGEAGRVLLRIPAHEMALATVHPGVSPREAFGRVVEGLLAASGAPAAPSPESAAGRPFARFEDTAAFEQAAWGRRVS